MFNRLFCFLLLAPGLAFAGERKLPDDFTGIVKYADAATVQEWYDEGREFVVLDVRTEKEYRQDGHIPDSVLEPYSLNKRKRKANDEMLARVAEDYGADTTLLVMCSHGMRATHAGFELQESKGFSNVYVFPGGFEGHYMSGYGSGDGWKAAGLPLED